MAAADPRVRELPAEASAQLALALDVLDRHLASTLLAVHLYGSALDGGLKPLSDIDLLVTVSARLKPDTRRALSLGLLEISAWPGQSDRLRALEVTVVVRDDIVPWRYPARREFQFGEWIREDVRSGIFEPAVVDFDLAILLTKAWHDSVALAGPPARDLFDPVPAGDLGRALADTVDQWNAPPDWAGDERNVVLALARIWYSAATGKIAPKDAAADWVIERLPAVHRPVLAEARQAYLGLGEDRLSARAEQLTDFVRFMKREIGSALESDARASR